MKAWELLKLLDEGKTLQRMYHNDPGCIKTLHIQIYRAKNYQVNPQEDDLTYYEVYRYEFFGWGSACGTDSEQLVELIKNPEEWTVKDDN